MKKTLLVSALLTANLILNAQTYTNGGLSTGATSKSGTAAPAGYTWSELQNDTGNTTESNTNLGFGAMFTSAASNLFIADDFIIPPNTQWQISTIDLFAYQTSYLGTTSPFNTIRINILNADPSTSGAVSVFGNDTTNRFSSSTDSGMYRIGNTAVPTPGTTATNRKIWKITANTPVTLGPGTYWVKFQLQNIVPANGGFLPPVTIVGSRGLSSFNAKQNDAVAGTWTALADTGNPAAAPDLPMDMPFVITFTTTSLGTKEVMQYDNRIQVYPNPVKDSFKINNPERIKIQSIEIIDVSGKLVKVLKASDEYHVSDLPAGNYILKMISEGLPSKITKLIKQ